MNVKQAVHASGHMVVSGDVIEVEQMDACIFHLCAVGENQPYRQSQDRSLFISHLALDLLKHNAGCIGGSCWLVLLAD